MSLPSDPTVIRSVSVRKCESHDDVIGHCRELLGEDGDGMSDEELDALRRSAEEMARVLIGVLLAKTGQAKEP